MKSVFSICKIFSFCFFVIYSFSSCTSYLIVNGNQHVPKKVTINVTGYDTSTGHLTLMDDSSNPADTFPAWHSQHIRWKLTDPRHHKIDSLYAKAVNLNEIFEDEPHKVFLSKSWKGTIKDEAALNADTVKDINGHKNYDYKMIWDTAGGQHTYDPRIQIKP
jgi:hypothetical protein